MTAATTAEILAMLAMLNEAWTPCGSNVGARKLNTNTNAKLIKNSQYSLSRTGGSCAQKKNNMIESM